MNVIYLALGLALGLVLMAAGLVRARQSTTAFIVAVLGFVTAISTLSFVVLELVA